MFGYKQAPVEKKLPRLVRLDKIQDLNSHQGSHDSSLHHRNAGGTTITTRDNGGVAIQITGTGASARPNTTTIPGATAAGSPTGSYGSFKFTTRVDP